MFAEYLRDAVMASHLPTVEFIIQNFRSFDLVNHVYAQCETLCSPLHSATFPWLYLGGMYSAITHMTHKSCFLLFRKPANLERLHSRGETGDAGYQSFKL